MTQVTITAYANSFWKREDGGKLRLWPPKTAAGTGTVQVMGSTSMPNGHSDLRSNGVTDSSQAESRSQSGSPKANHYRSASGIPTGIDGSLLLSSLSPMQANKI